MIFEIATFERLFPVVPSGTGLLTETNFGFESRNKRYFDVTISGSPKIEQGMTVIALLEKPNGWEFRGLLGWVNCQDGAVVCDSAVKLFCIGLMCMFFAVMFRIRAYELFRDSEVVADSVAIFVVLSFGGLALRHFYLAIKAMLIKKALLAAKTVYYEHSMKRARGG